ncbi:hypothetical protein J2801_006123 [Paraburkholderia phenoliruptrix]|uniref:hypothetical protein n=1 Tax=Paraburkholderia phenoliruptrix TaxID=252970 RepID=UPI002866DEEA|nr:hypothetical protein [Paraburkholderia phenoliruptrix]MDR6423819.1 hypothetical protein [Paraburkholderia phenoliruptrix]
MNRLNLEHRITDDGEHHLVLSLPDGPYTMCASDVEVLVQTLAEYREIMLPPVTMEAPPGPRAAVLDPRCSMVREPTINGCGMHLRHPGLGWISFGIPRRSLVELCSITGRLLSELQDEQQPTFPN